MTGESNVSGPKKRSVTWNFFKKLNRTHAECNYCHGLYNYKTTMSHLLKHMKRKHPDALLQYYRNQNGPLANGKIDSPAPPADEISMPSSPEVEVPMQADESENGEKSADEEQSSDIWSLFTRIEGAFAKCNLCQIKLSCKDSISDLTKHREVDHPGVLLKCDSSENEPSTNGLDDISAAENCSLTPQNSKDSSSNDDPAADSPAKDGDMKLRKSPAWQYFTLIDKTYAECKICRMSISHLSISNLMKHVVRKHPCELLARARSHERRDAEKIVDDDSGDAEALQSQDQSRVSDVEEGSEEEASEEVDQVKKNTSNAPSSDDTSGVRCSKRLKTKHSPVKIELEDVSPNENLHSSQDQNSVLEDNSAAGEERPAAPRSCVWKIFTKLDNGRCLCRVCGVTMSKKSSVSNLLRHIKRAHLSSNSGVQRKTATRAAVEIRNRLQGARGPIIHTFQRALHSDSVAAESGSEAERTADGSERLVRAVEEGNRLLRGLQEAVERQGRALERLAACLEGMNGVNKESA